jgi:uncharacterized protein YegP (UPF0339 family)
MKGARVVIFQDTDLKWRWHLQSANGRVLAQGESHSRERDARRAVDTVSEALLMAEVVVKSDK